MQNLSISATDNNDFGGDWDPMEEDYHSKYFNTYSDPMKDLEQGKQVNVHEKHSPLRYKDISPTKVDSNVVNLYVGNMPSHLTKDGLYNLFCRAGKVVSAKVCQPKNPGADRTFGFVAFENVREAEEAIRLFHGKELVNGVPLKVHLANSNEGTKRSDPSCSSSNGFSNGRRSPALSSQSAQESSLQQVKSTPSPPVEKHPPITKRTPAESGDRGSCSYCGVYGPLKRCAACKTPYCGVSCQREDWAVHKSSCSFQSSTPKGTSAQTAGQNSSECSFGRIEDFESRFDIVIDDADEAMDQLITGKIGKTTVNGRHGSSVASIEEKPSPPQASSVQVLVGDVQGDGVVYANVLNQDNSTRLLQVTERLIDDAASSNLRRLDVGACRTGCKVAVLYEGEWSRAEIVDVSKLEHGIVNICFIDYGNAEEKPVSDLYLLPGYASQLPAQAQQFTLLDFPVARSPAEKDALQKVASDVLMDQLLRLESVPGSQSGSDVVRLYNEEEKDCCQLICAAFEKHMSELQLKEAPASSATPRDNQVAPLVAETPIYVTVLSSKVPFEPMPPVGSTCGIVVLHVVSPQQIHFQLVNKGGENVKQTTQMMDDLGVVYSSSAADPDFRPSCGELCVGLFDEDKSWYRISVLSYNDDNEDVANVRYVDYGNTAHVSVKDMRRIEAKFTRLPRQARQCCVTREKPNREVMDKFVKFLNSHALSEILQVKIMDNLYGKSKFEFVDSEMKSTVTSILSNKAVESRDPGVPKSDVKPLAVSQAPCASPVKAPLAEPQQAMKPSRRRVMVAEAVLPSDDFSVVVTHVESPGEFYGQLADRETIQLGDSISQRLSAKHANNQLKTIDDLRSGDFCVALYSDGAWYRARITSRDQLSANVQYIDFGNSESVQLTDIRELDASDAGQATLAIGMQLAGIAPSKSAHWSPVASQQFAEMALNQVARVKRCSRKNDDGHVPVCLGVGENAEQDPAEKLIALNVAVATKQSEPVQWMESYNEAASASSYLHGAKVSAVPGSKCSILIGEVINPHLFYATFVKADPRENRIELTPRNVIGAPVATDIRIGSIYCVKDDGRHCRVIVENISADSERVRVRLVDYGVSRVALASELLRIDDNSKAMAFCSFPCSLHCVRPSTDDNCWTEDCCALLKELLPSNGEPVPAVVIGKTEGRVVLSPVIRSESPDRVADALVRKGLARYTPL